MYKGAMGCGKTLTLVKDGLQLHNLGYRVLRNFSLPFGEYLTNDDILKLDKDSDVDNCVLLIDEIQMFLDSRMGMKKANLRFSYFIQQIRKRNITLLCTTQFARNVDLRLKQHIDVEAHPRFLKEFGVCEVTYVDLTQIENNFLLNVEPSQVKIVYDASPIFDIYNTFEKIT